MTIDKKEYLQVGYKPELFQAVRREDYRRIHKTAVDPMPQQNQHWQSKGHQDHHIFVETFEKFASYISNKYDVIHFTNGATAYEVELAEGLLNEDGSVIFD